MIFKGKYDVVFKDKTITTFNNIQPSGFNYFINCLLDKKEKIIFDNQTVQQVIVKGFDSIQIYDNKQIITNGISTQTNGYLQSQVTTQKYYEIVFNKSFNINAIGIVVDYNGVSNLENNFSSFSNYTPNIFVEYYYNNVKTFATKNNVKMSINAYYSSQDANYKEKNEQVYYCDGILADKIRFVFNTDNNQISYNYRLFGINLYEKVNKRPTHFCLYDENDVQLGCYKVNEIEQLSQGDYQIAYRLFLEQGIELNNVNKIALGFYSRDVFYSFSKAIFNVNGEGYVWNKKKSQFVSINYILTLNNE